MSFLNYSKGGEGQNWKWLNPVFFTTAFYLTKTTRHLIETGHLFQIYFLVHNHNRLNLDFTQNPPISKKISAGLVTCGVCIESFMGDLCWYADIRVPSQNEMNDEQILLPRTAIQVRPLSDTSRQRQRQVLTYRATQPGGAGRLAGEPLWPLGKNNSWLWSASPALSPHIKLERPACQAKLWPTPQQTTEKEERSVCQPEIFTLVAVNSKKKREIYKMYKACMGPSLFLSLTDGCNLL